MENFRKFWFKLNKTLLWKYFFSIIDTYKVLKVEYLYQKSFNNPQKNSFGDIFYFKSTGNII